MNIIVDEQPKRFWLSVKTDFDKYEWKPVAGHGITVGDYNFLIACLPGDILNVSEATTGCKVFETKLTMFDFMFTSTKEDTMVFYRDYVGDQLKKIIEKVPNFQQRLFEKQKEREQLLGKMPEIEDVDDSIITAPFSDLMN